jgi:hypothetical protein
VTRRSSKRRSSRRPVRPNFDVGPSGRTFEEKAAVGDGTRENPIVIESIDDVDAFLGSPGYYQTTSTFPAYAVVKALDGWHPLFEGGMDMPFVEGNVFFFRVLEEPTRHDLPGAVPDGIILDDTEHALRANALVAMGVSPDFWSKLLQRYRNWELAWWREVAQNSRDAEATQMDFGVVQGVYADPESGGEVPAMVVTAYDNGVGMDADVLRRALLTRGGSVKPEQAVGGFGDAKNLILFPWLGWKVETRDLVAFGQHESVVEPPGVHKAPSAIQGTRITVWMPLTQTTAETYAQQLLGRSYLPGVRVRVNGKTVAADLMGGEEVAKASLADDSGKVVGEIVASHHHSARANKGLYVRARGVFMFEEYAPNIPGVVYVDVNAPAKYVFDASRNSLIGAARTFVERVKAQLAKEPETLLRSKKWKAEKIYRGTGSIEVREGRAAEVAAKAVAKVADQIAKRQAQKKPLAATEVAELAKETADAMEEDAASAPPPVTPEEVTAQRMQSSRETATALVSASMKHATTTEQVATALRYAMWKPDLFMANQMPFWKPPAGLEPETMEAKYIVLLRAWTEACKFGLNILGEFRPFGVGFIMMLDGYSKMPVLGAYERKDGTDWLMINPVTFIRGKYDYEAHEHVWTLEGDRIDLSTDEGIEELCSTAIHEITHLQGFMAHDDVFASALGKNMSVAHRGQADLVKVLLKSIRSETRARFAEIRQEKAAAKAIPWDVIVGRVTVLLSWWDGLSGRGQSDLNSGESSVEALAKDAGRRANDLAREVPLVISKTNDPWREIALKPKVLVKLHDAANATGAFGAITEEEARQASKVWKTMPPDPRVRQAPLVAPEGIAVLSWTRSGKEWVLREGYAGQRGAEVMRYEGGVSDWDRRRQRDPDSEARVVEFLGEKLGRWPGTANVYVWHMSSGTEWYLRLNGGLYAIAQKEDARHTIRLSPDSAGQFHVFSNTPGVPSYGGFHSVAEAQKYVMDAVVRQRAEG